MMYTLAILQTKGAAYYPLNKVKIIRRPDRPSPVPIPHSVPSRPTPNHKKIRLISIASSTTDNTDHSDISEDESFHSYRRNRRHNTMKNSDSSRYSGYTRDSPYRHTHRYLADEDLTRSDPESPESPTGTAITASGTQSAYTEDLEEQKHGPETRTNISSPSGPNPMFAVPSNIRYNDTVSTKQSSRTYTYDSTNSMTGNIGSSNNHLFSPTPNHPGAKLKILDRNDRNDSDHRERIEPLEPLSTVHLHPTPALLSNYSRPDLMNDASTMANYGDDEEDVFRSQVESVSAADTLCTDHQCLSSHPTSMAVDLQLELSENAGRWQCESCTVCHICLCHLH